MLTLYKKGGQKLKNISTIIITSLIFSYCTSSLLENNKLFGPIALVSFIFFYLINYLMKKFNIRQITKVYLINSILIGLTIISFIFLNNLYISIGISLGTLSTLIISIVSYSKLKNT